MLIIVPQVIDWCSVLHHTFYFSGAAAARAVPLAMWLERTRHFALGKFLF